ncbi:MAG: TatD family hydrolase [Acidimicrobiales bacterium]
MRRLGRILGGGQHARKESGTEPASSTREAAAPDAALGQDRTDEIEAAAAAAAVRGEHLASLALWTDSHCHLQSSDDLGGVIERGRESGVRRLVFVGTDEASSREAAIAVGERSGSGSPAVEMWSTVGLHPHDASTGVGGVGRLLRELYSSGRLSSQVVAVGECGLDYHYDYSPRAVQRDAFAAQIAFAHQYGLALVVHTREAWDDTFAIIDREGAPARLVLHCFTGGPQEAAACLERGAYLSFSGIVTFPSATDVRDAVTVCPIERLLVETDAPFLTPVPHRGKPNEPSYIPVIGAQIAALKGLGEAAVAQATTSNAAVVFGLHG